MNEEKERQKEIREKLESDGLDHDECRNGVTNCYLRHKYAYLGYQSEKIMQQAFIRRAQRTPRYLEYFG